LDRHSFRSEVVLISEQFIEGLHRHKSCTRFLHEFLDLIQYDMLVVESDKRKSCADISKCLDEMSRICNQSEDYAATSSSYCKRTPVVSHYIGPMIAPESAQGADKRLSALRPDTLVSAPAVQSTGLSRARSSRIPRRKKGR
jgi:hypothetical protein